MTFSEAYFLISAICAYLITVIVMRELFIIELKPLPRWLAELFWWAVLPAKFIERFIRRGGK